jgi:hypothetical protein
VERNKADEAQETRVRRGGGQWVVTAARCVQGAGSFRVRVGTTTWNSGGTLVNSSDVRIGSGDI